jgi:hypothetical protein
MSHRSWFVAPLSAVAILALSLWSCAGSSTPAEKADPSRLLGSRGTSTPELHPYRPDPMKRRPGDTS